MKNILRFFTILLITANLVSSVDISKKILRSSVIYGCPDYHYEFNFVIPDADINGDGYKDIIGKSEVFNGWSSYKWVLYGSEEGFPEEASICEYNGRMTLIGTSHWDPTFGISAGDYNGDGYDDVAIGNCISDIHTEFSETWILYGGADWPEIIKFWDLPSNIKVSIIRGRSLYSYLGEYILTEDINGDGYDDLMLTERIQEEEEYIKLYIFYGAPNELPEYIDTSNLSENTIIFNIYCIFFPKVGDINRDNLIDLIFKSYWDGFINDRKYADIVLILYNSTSGFLTEVVDPLNPPENSTIIYGAKEMDSTGDNVLFKDIDLDGFKDLIISAPGAESLDGKTKFVGKVWNRIC